MNPRTGLIIPQNYLDKMTPEDRKSFGKAGMTWAEVEVKCDHDLELKFHAQVINYFRQKEPPIAYVHANPTRKSTIRKGWPDFTIAVRGQAVAFELKGPNGELSEDQIAVRAEMEANGWRYIVAHNLGQIREVINDLEMSI